MSAQEQCRKMFLYFKNTQHMFTLRGVLTLPPGPHSNLVHCFYIITDEFVWHYNLYPFILPFTYFISIVISHRSNFWENINARPIFPNHSHLVLSSSGKKMQNCHIYPLPGGKAQIILIWMVKFPLMYGRIDQVEPELEFGATGERKNTWRPPCHLNLQGLKKQFPGFLSCYNQK